MRELPLPTMPLSDLRAPAASRRSLHQRSAHVHDTGLQQARYEVVWARHDDDVRQAQQLRHLIFAEEMGARLRVPDGSPPGHDIDLFDPYCEHLLVRAAGVAGEPVIGTYRVLTPAAA
jgi:putative hemolysin